LLAERAAANAAQIEAACGANSTDKSDALGPDSEEEVIKEEYENEEQVATVTIVEDLDLDALIHPEIPLKHPVPDSSNRDQDQTKLPEHRTKVPKSPSTTIKTPGTSKIDTTKKPRYETRAARLAEKRKQQTRKFEKSARAGGKKLRPSKRR
jgi:ribosomal RNA-processing protein 17